jgi:hypothetical protein
MPPSSASTNSTGHSERCHREHHRDHRERDQAGQGLPDQGAEVGHVGQARGPLVGEPPVDGVLVGHRALQGVRDQPADADLDGPDHDDEEDQETEGTTERSA